MLDPHVFEKLGLFYLGRDVEKPDEPFVLSSQNFTTHAMCVGMTGSGKTGLGIGLLEEAAMDQIPAIIIDPKGDLANLFLTFNPLDGAALSPWVDEDEARRQNLSVEDFAAAQAQMWSEGLASWGQGPDRIDRLKQQVRYRLYTPGSSSGEPLSILSALQTPSDEVLQDRESLGIALEGASDSLLSLVGVEGEEASRARALLSAILSDAWTRQESLRLPELVRRIQTPPFEQLGVLPVDQYYPQKDRTKLVMAFNNLLASPSFQSWLEGEPLSVDRLLYSEDGRPQHAVISIAHLSDRERMFFVSLLLNQVVQWVRSQRGTSSLRALLYMDEVYGYLPPVAEPPSKKAMLTLLKQARAYGLGVVLSTQNPGDLDYKALGNLGTWFIGRLTAERDREKLLDGLQTGDLSMQRQEIEEHLANLGKRQFVMASMHERRTVTFETRWVMAYLRGPMTQTDHRLLYDLGLLTRRIGVASAATAAASPNVPVEPSADASIEASQVQPDVREEEAAGETEDRMLTQMPTGIPVLFARDLGQIAYPHLWGQIQVVYEDKSRSSVTTQTNSVYVPIEEAVTPLRWDRAEADEQTADAFDTEKPSHVELDTLPKAASDSKNYSGWRRDLIDWVYREHGLTVLSHELTGLTSKPGEARRDFVIRVQEALHEARDEALAKLEASHEKEIQKLDKQIDTAERTLEREASQVDDAKRQTAISTGGAILGWLLGRKKASIGNIGRASSVVRGASRTKRQADDVKRAEARIDDLEAKKDAYAEQLEAEMADIAERYLLDEADLIEKTERPLKKNIRVDALGILWR